jgi:replicative DNA helicase
MTTPPHDLAAERAVIGAGLLNRHAIQSDLPADAFYHTAHKVIWAEVLRLDESGVAPDTVMLAKLFKDSQRLEDIGGVSYLSELTSQVPSVASAEHYAKLVRKHSDLRKLLWGATEIAQECYVPDADPEALASKLIDVTEFGSQDTEAADCHSMLREYGERLERIYHGKEPAGLSTGLVDVDRLCPLHGGDLLVIAGRPGMGKTSIAVDCLRGVCASGGAVAVYSLEMGREQITELIIAQEGGVTRSDIRSRTVNESDFGKTHQAISRAAQYKFWVCDMGDINVQRIRRHAKALNRKHDLKTVIIDYVQLMETGNREQRYLEIGRISRACKQLAKELNCVVFLLSQLNRNVEERPDKKPRLSDLRESGSLEQDADVVWLLWRPEHYWPLDEEGISREEESKRYEFQGLGWLICAKQRGGITFKQKLSWSGSKTSYGNFVSNDRWS